MKQLTVSMTKSEQIAGWIYLPVQLLAIPLILAFANLLLGSPLSDAQLNFVYFCVNFLCITVIFRQYLLDCGRISLKDPMRLLSSAALGFGLYWLLATAVAFFILAVYPEFYNVNDESIGTLMDQNAGLIAFGTVLLVPVAEEVLYRGLIFRGLYNRNKLAAYVISVFVFAALHVISYIGQYEPVHLMLCLLQYIPAGVCLGWAYARADSIWAPILIHICVNLIGILSM